MIGKLISISAGVGGRAVFGLVFAVTVIRNLPGEASVLFFQVLLLQSVFVNLIGGGGFVRGAAQSGSTAGSVRLLRGFCATLALALGGSFGLVALFGMPGDLAHWQILMLLFAGSCTALNAQLMGILSGVTGVRHIFLPLSALFLTMSGILLLVPPDGFDGAIAIAAISQTAPLVMLLVMKPEARDLLRRVINRHQEKCREPWRPVGSLIIGVAAAGYLLIFYGFRENWSAGMAPEFAAAAFFAYRISDTYMQVFSIAAAGLRGLALRLERIAISSGPKTTMAMAAVLMLGMLQIAALSGLRSLLDTSAILCIFLAMQLTCEILRSGTVLVSVMELGSGRSLRFLVLSVVPAALAAAIGQVSDLFSGPAGLFYFQTVFAGLQIAGWLAMAGSARYRRANTRAELR